MRWKNESKFALFGLNQEKILSELAKEVQLFGIDRIEKTKTEFTCSYFDRKHVQKFLTQKGAKWELLENHGFFCSFSRALKSYGLIFAIVLSSALWAFQSQNVVQFQILGLDSLEQTEIVEFIKENHSMKKSELNVDKVEKSLLENFEEISFVSCIIKGQTLVVNIKERLMPDEMYGEFAPIYASESGKITSISLVSGTLNVEVGDYVQAGDVLVFPYVFDSSGTLKKVEACADISAEVFHTGTAEHYETKITLERTGNFSVESKITLFGLTIYTFSEGEEFEIFEVEQEETGMTENLFLPFKLITTTKFELVEKRIESSFEDAKDEVISSARESAASDLADEEILDEYYAIRHISTLTIVTYTIVTQQVIS